VNRILRNVIAMERLAEARGATQELKASVPSTGDHELSLVNQRAQRCSRLTVKVVIYLYSEVVMLAIRLPQSIEKRLEKLARRTGRTKTYYVREAILEHLEEIEDLYLAEGALERIRSGEERTIPLKQVMKRHGLQR
jgi:RHH-type transcriptional regulator, rel operon repressor / antitoxin RelB